jgi:hypothetical protein
MIGSNIQRLWAMYRKLTSNPVPVKFHMLQLQAKEVGNPLLYSRQHSFGDHRLAAVCKDAANGSHQRIRFKDSSAGTVP